MKRIKNSGVTLIELLVATSVIAILTILMMNFLASRLVDNASKNAHSDLELQSQLTLDVISRDIKHSANVDEQNRWPDDYAPGAPGNVLSWSSDGTTLVLARPSEDTSQNILFEDQTGYVSYKNNLIYFKDSSGTLYKRILAAPVAGNGSQSTCPAGTAGCSSDIRLAQNVDSFALSYFDANDNPVPASEARSVAINLSLSKTVFNRDLNIQQSIRAVFRNE